MNPEISIGVVKRDISELVNRVAFKGERIILTSRGRPKAVLIGMEDFAKLQELDSGRPARADWLAEARNLAARIRERRGGYLIDVDDLIVASREDLESRAGE